MLDRLAIKNGSKHSRRRIGRGIGSGMGKTSTRGTKGAGARTGYKAKAWSEGGQMPLVRRLPKRGFRNPFTIEYQVVNVSDLGSFKVGSEVDPAALVEAGLISTTRRPVKLLGDGEFKAALRFKVQAVSKPARAKIEAAGGSIELIALPGTNKIVTPKPKQARRRKFNLGGTEAAAAPAAEAAPAEEAPAPKRGRGKPAQSEEAPE